MSLLHRTAHRHALVIACVVTFVLAGIPLAIHGDHFFAQPSWQNLFDWLTSRPALFFWIVYLSAKHEFLNADHEHHPHKTQPQGKTAL